MIWPLAQGEAIGLDIGRRHVKAVQMSGSRLTAAVCIPRYDSNANLSPGELTQVANVLRARPFRGRTVVTAVPASQLMTSIVELPPRSSGAPLEQLARIELGRRYDVQPEAVEMACWDLPSPVRAASRTCLMAVACTIKDGDRLVDDLESQGLSVEALDVHALALSRACRPMLDTAGDAAAILDVGWASSRLVLLYKGVVVYERNLTKHGLDSLARLLAEQGGMELVVAEQTLMRDGLSAFGAPAADHSVTLRGEKLPVQLESMAGEIRTPLSYLASQYSDAAVKHLVLVGGGANVKGLADCLSARLGIDTVCPGLADLCMYNDSVEDLGPSIATAIGLAKYSEGRT